LRRWDAIVATPPEPEVAVKLVGETIWHESDRLQALGQYPREGVTEAKPFGPGLGPASMEEPTWQWLLADFVKKKPDIALAFSAYCTIPVPPYQEFAWNLALNVLGCRLRYYADRRVLPKLVGGVEARAAYWAIIYNGSGVAERRIKYERDAYAIPWGLP